MKSANSPILLIACLMFAIATSVADQNPNLTFFTVILGFISILCLVGAVINTAVIFVLKLHHITGILNE